MFILTDGQPAARDVAAGWESSLDRDITGDAAAHGLAPLVPLWRRLDLQDSPPVFGAVAATPADRFWSCLLIQAAAPGSQFDALRELLGEGLDLPGPTACLALTGCGFHGNRGRSWQAEPGNLHLSVAVPLDLPADRLGPALTMLPVVAAMDAITAGIPAVDRPGTTSRPGIKWVNDIFVAGQKVAGVLTATLSEGNRLECGLFGLGINLARAPEIRPTPFVPRAGCLRDLPGADTVTLPALTASLLAALARRLAELIEQGPGPLAAAYRAESLVLDREVVVWREGFPDDAPLHEWPAPVAVGRVVGIEPDLRLRLAGSDEPVASGRLAFIEDWHGFTGQRGTT